ncbi:peptidase T [Salmonella enterica]|uniref:Peptidase T n=1 Tax=Salmonella enterica subsp. enterica serovar Rough O:d:1,7 TaxID=1974323 RepID=A0A974QCK4_SALET|nr:peptidase T [Salmonella enterica]EBW8396438.1 peptidase T [Salmonella enterica subsp. enterica serovar Florida]ECC9077978.1 peptidase T [Salmonella enterica subsp. enterica]EAO5287077.1 peptidase T [Salmonella enterica]EAS1839150.1 peptidase T [Salmonella enterica]EAV3945448.1 peptidase T [Salmonella enterica]
MKQRINAEQITATFLGYTVINTTSVPSSPTLPSCDNQYKLAQQVAGQFSDIRSVRTDIQGNAITTITLPANCPDCPAIVFFAHLDTAPEHTGDTRAIRINHYDGRSILLPGSGEVLSPDENPELHTYTGQDIITTDGTSLLGADDKAAIAAGVEALRYMVDHPDFRHGDISLVLLPDEETGIRGAKALDVAALNADYGICLDCCGVGEYVTENWYAGSALLTFTGVTAHPMNAKGKLVNALDMATEAVMALPAKERPEHTEGREGYYWPHKLTGETGRATLEIAIRDFETEGYQDRKTLLLNLTRELKQRWGENRVKIEFSDTYDNVRPALDKNPSILENVQQAMRNLGIEPKPVVMRGGYDGSVITPRGLPTVNIFTGAHNFHSTREFLPVESLRLAGEMLLELVELSCREMR